MGARNNRKNGKYSYVDSELAWEYIEMGKDIDELYPESWRRKITIPKSFLLPGEKYHFLTDDLAVYALTSNSRVISCATVRPRQMVPTFLPYRVNLAGISGRKTINITAKLSEYGWSKSVSEVYDIYMKYRWKFYLSENNTTTIYNDIRDEE